MNSRQRIKSIIAGKSADRCGFWLGNPHPDSWQALHQYFGTSSEEELRLLLKDDFHWITPWDAYHHPEGKPVFDMQKPGKTLSEGGVFADTVSIKEVENFDCPNPEYLDFSRYIDILVSPELFNEFIFPYFKELTDLGREFNKQIILHSCGSIFRVMDDLIGLGVNAFHPLQAKAARE